VKFSQCEEGTKQKGVRATFVVLSILIQKSIKITKAKQAKGLSIGCLIERKESFNVTVFLVPSNSFFN